jgi:hypothetical protein
MASNGGDYYVNANVLFALKSNQWIIDPCMQFNIIMQIIYQNS